MKLFQSPGFKIRFKISIGIAIVILVGMLTPDCSALRIVYAVAAMIATVEVYALWMNATGDYSFFHDFFGVSCGSLAAMFLLVCSMLIGFGLPGELLTLAVILAMTSDAAGYMVGKLIGTKLIPGHPFPRISPNKSYEGCLGAMLSSIPIYFICRAFWPTWFGYALPGIVMLTGTVAMFGDLYESALKRIVGAKDSNDVLVNYPGFRMVEKLLGGKDGHGGFYDRLDSISTVVMFFFVVYLENGRP